MSDDQAPERDRARGPRTRPAFLPPMDRHDGRPPPVHPAVYPMHEDPAARGSAWNIGVIIAGSVLLISAFLPWAEARISIDLFGRVLTRDLGTVAGLEADNVVVAVPVLAMVAIAMSFWGVIGRDTRVSALAAIPGVLSLLVCALFVLRLGDIKNRLAAEDLSVGYEVAVVVGWYLAVAMSLLVIGFSLARPVVTRRIGAPRPHEAEPAHATAYPMPGHGAQWPAEPQAAQHPDPRAQYPDHQGGHPDPQEQWPNTQPQWPQDQAQWPNEEPQRPGQRPPGTAGAEGAPSEGTTPETPGQQPD